MKTVNILFGLVTFAAALAGCNSSGSGVGSALSQSNSDGPINGFWKQTSMMCSGTDISNSTEDVTLTIAGARASLSTSFDNGAGATCTVRWQASATYGESTVQMTFGEATCSPECPALTCISGRGQPTPLDFNYVLAEPNLRMTTQQGSMFGCATGQDLQFDFTR
jgi:hypothetical protein